MCNNSTSYMFCALSNFMATPRIEHLAQPKPNLLRYPDRPWRDELPLQRSSSTTTTFELTPRWSQLCRSKRSHTGVEGQFRDSPTWVVNEWALRAHPSERVCSLALPHPPTAGWQPARPLLAPLSGAGQTAVATPRTCQLAQPKRKLLLDTSIHEIKTTLSSSKPAKPSPRIELLATPKHNHPKYVGDRPASWPIPGAVRRAVASHRVLELSHPKERTALFEGYDPYIVSQAALSANPSLRLQELCKPLPRKNRPM